MELEQFRQALPKLYERDLDLIIQEELVLNAAMRALVAGKLSLDEPILVDACELSINDPTGETDIVAHCSIGNAKGMLLIENKIDAMFQPRQPERYRERVVALSTRPGINFSYCALLAPTRYIESNPLDCCKFDLTISYEDVAAAILAEKGPRSSYRANLLLHAIELARAAYVMNPIEAVGATWQRIYAIASAEFPRLDMERPRQKGASSSWVLFKGNLPSRTTIDWKIKAANVDLSFWPGPAQERIAALSPTALPIGSSRQMVGRTLVIRLHLSRLAGDWLAIRDDEIRTALAAAQSLLDFHNGLAVNAS